MKKSFFSFVGLMLLASYSFCQNNISFEQMWQDMQVNYAKLHEMEKSVSNFYLVQPLWHDHRQPIMKYLMGAPKINFLRGPMGPTMITGAVSKESKDYVMNKVQPTTKTLLKRFKETTFGGIKTMCSALKCTTDSLRHLYFMARVLDNKEKNVEVMVELGGGYGCLARIAKSIYPGMTYIIIDLPEILSLQSLFLSGASPEFTQKIHTTIPENFEKGVIHLVPYYLVPDLEIDNVDVFISIVALSETSKAMQNLIIAKNFFNAHMGYIMGQKKHPKSPNQSTIVNNIKRLYPSSDYQSYNHYYGGCYEIMGLR